MKKIVTIVSFLTFYLSDLFPCTNFLITKGATIDGSTMITYAADSHVLYGELYHWPAMDYEEGDSLDIIEWDTGKKLGRIPQVRHTYNVVGNMNEHQLAIGETTYTGREELQDTLGMMDYGSLMYIALQRTRTARDAILLIDELVSKYGYNSTGESLSISDPNEVWIMEIIGKGLGNKGAVWVARKIPDGYISGHANQARITTFPFDDPENCLYAEDVISFAREKGYFNGKDKDFSFADAYAPIDFGGARFCESRVWSGFRRVNSNMMQYEDYAMGENLDNRMPLWIKPDKKLSVKDVMELMRDYFEGTKMDMTKDFGAGPYECIVRWRPLVWAVDSGNYFNERAISTQQTGFSFVAQSRNWLPDPVGGILWFGVDDTYSTVYTPMYCGIERVPSGFAVGNGSIMHFSDSAAFWVFNQVSNFAYTRYNYIIPHIREKQAMLEEAYIKEVKETDSEAKELYGNNPQEAIAMITEFSCERGNNTVIEWKELYKYIFTRYMDGNIKTAIEGQQNPKLEQPGYSEYWYRQLVNQTGDKFIYKSNSSH
ncbi:MAG: C69 family dipeptidase [Bacteroidales bacterium]|nr:C69 family dipeptidase [Bacteroidales bacterium]